MNHGRWIQNPLYKFDQLQGPILPALSSKKEEEEEDKKKAWQSAQTSLSSFNTYLYVVAYLINVLTDSKFFMAIRIPVKYRYKLYQMKLDTRMETFSEEKGKK